MITAVLDQGGFDVSRTVALSWCQDRLNRANRRAEWTKSTVSLGNTVADQAEYAIPSTVLVLRDVYVGSRKYVRVGADRLGALKHAGSSVDFVYAPDWTSAGVEQIELYPVPTVSGTAITGQAVTAAATLVDTTAEITAIPVEFHEEILVDGGIATGIARLDEGVVEADRFEARWETAVERLRRLKTSRIGSGPVRFQVAGHHF
jgi:hypothetical protein